MNRISVTNLRNAFARYAETAEAFGWDVTGWQMTEGSNGEAYRLGVKGNAAAPNLPGTDSYGIIGYSRREAFETLWTIIRTMQAMGERNK